MELKSFKNIKKSEFKIMFISVYEKPLDYKNKFVARIFDVDKPTEFYIIKDSLEDIRKDIQNSFKGCALKFDRDDMDVKSIVETYMIY